MTLMISGQLVNVPPELEKSHQVYCVTKIVTPQMTVKCHSDTYDLGCAALKYYPIILSLMSR